MSGTLRLQNKYPNLQYQYDLNGNVTTDSVYNNFSISYDHRNLITELYHIDTLTSTRQYSYATRYWYDEAGNRVRKLTYRNAQIPPPQINDWNNPGNGWTLLNNEHYVRGVDGKELATYTSNNLTEWYVWASDMVGKIRGNAKYFFFKDHLSSVRAVVDNNFNLVSAVDGACPRVLLAGDMWGDKMQGRIYNGDSTKFGFTGKEEDDENLYDYFGARYYDSRIGRWGQVEPLLEKYLSLSLYSYSLDNPLNITDPDGYDPRRNQLGSLNDVVELLEQNRGELFTSVQSIFSTSETRYIYTENSGFLDLQHFFADASTSAVLGIIKTLKAGEFVESQQERENNPSAWDPEDLPSNLQGAIFGVSMNSVTVDDQFISVFVKYLMKMFPVDKDDPTIGNDKLYIPEDEFDIPLPTRKSYIPYRGELPNYRELVKREKNIPK